VTISALSEASLLRVFGYAIIFVEVCGGLVVLAGVGRAIVGYVRAFVLNYQPEKVTELRIMLGRSMVVALEFQVAADILKTGLSPNWEDILLLAAIVAVRTVLNFLLERELQFLGEDHPLRAVREGCDD
jgi:uncharacterized membrane protein